MKVISDEETVCLSLSRVVQLFPRLSDGEWDCCADRAALPLPLLLILQIYCFRRIEMLNG